MHYGRKNYLKIDWRLIECSKRRRWVKWFGHLYLATPGWADKKAMKEIYDERDRRNKRDGAGTWEIDHIVPLHHPDVCGLHNEFNIQILTAKANAAKSNHTWPDMPDETLDMFDLEPEPYQYALPLS